MTYVKKEAEHEGKHRLNQGNDNWKKRNTSIP